MSGIITVAQSISDGVFSWKDNLHPGKGGGGQKTEIEATVCAISSVLSEELDFGTNWQSNFISTSKIEVVKQNQGNQWEWADRIHGTIGWAKTASAAARLALESALGWDGITIKRMEHYALHKSGAFMSDGEIVMVIQDDPAKPKEIVEIMAWSDLQAVFDYMSGAFSNGWTVENGRVIGVPVGPTIKKSPFFKNSKFVTPPPIGPFGPSDERPKIKRILIGRVKKVST